MAEDTPPSTATPPPATAGASGAPTQLLADDEYSRYLLHSRNEMIPVLKGLYDQVSQITMFFNEGRDMVLTSLVGYDETGLSLDFGPSNDLNRRALEADRLFCITQLEKVKIQFLLRGVSRIEVDGRPAFRAELPENMLRLQRREYFRLSMPITRPLKMVASIPQVDGVKRTMDIEVGDISGGGLALVNLPKTLPLEPGTLIEGCRLDLPEVGLVSANLKVCSVMETRTRSGASLFRAGCEFVKLPGPMATLIQRYIIKIERERKARESGLG